MTLLHRDDPNAEPLVGNIKVTREDWLNMARDVLISDGVSQVKVLGLADRMGVSRSSFYWYFKSRQDLLDALLTQWDATNTAALLSQAQAPARTITGAVCNIFRCTANPDLFSTALDFAIRDWSRRSKQVRAMLDGSDTRRLHALSAMFARYGYPPSEAETRARVLYFMQLGYDMADLNEDADARLERVADYVQVFTGKKVDEAELNDFVTYARSHWTKASP
ncbi:MAG: TetR/AcrR family transcriptional regulator [Sedimentitalea sp.]